jgi:ATP synthase F1 gamma subunit
MYNKYAIAEELAMVSTFKMLAQAYEEIAVIKMQRVRSSVLSTRQFLDALSLVFSEVKSSYKGEILQFTTKKKKKKNFNPLKLLSKKNKTVAVLLSSNTTLYGDIINRVYRLFVEEIKKGDYDIVIVGKHGKQLFDGENLGKKYTYFEIPDEGVSFEQLKPILSFVLEYEKVNMYYGKFSNVITQTPTVSNVSGEDLATEKQDDQKSKVKYIFEPTLEKIYELFENQVLVALFKQTVHEAELSRLASRITAMEQALGNIDKNELDLHAESRRVTKLLANKKQIDTFSGLSLWATKR